MNFSSRDFPGRVLSESSKDGCFSVVTYLSLKSAEYSYENETRLIALPASSDTRTLQSDLSFLGGRLYSQNLKYQRIDSGDCYLKVDFDPNMIEEILIPPSFCCYLTQWKQLLKNNQIDTNKIHPWPR